jgi:hypothetical protein
MTIILRPVADEDAVICVHRVFAGMHLVAEVGERFALTSWVVHEQPDCFVSVCRNVPRARAFVARESICKPSQKPGAQPWQVDVVVWARQWIDRDDPLVDLHPNLFAPLDAQSQ